MDTGVSENRTTSDSSAPKRPILQDESDALIARLKEVVGEESVSSFSRRCGFRESVLRGYLVDGKKPGVDYLVAIADAGSVTVDWLATGRPPKDRAALNAALQPAAPAAQGINRDALEAILEGALKLGKNAPAAAIAAHCVKVYKQCLDDGLITAEGIGTGNLNAAA